MLRSKVIAAVFLVCCLTKAYCNVGIPAILFSNIRSQFDGVERPGAAQIVTRDELTVSLNGLQQADVTVVFVQDEMSTEDFLKQKTEPSNEKVFPQLETLLSSSRSLYYPAVKSPSDSVADLKKNFDHVVEVSHNKNAVMYLTKSELKPKTLVIISLSPTKDQEFLVEKLRENDGVIGQIVKHLMTEKISYNAMYTAQKFRRQHQAVIQMSQRHLLQTVDDSDSPEIIYTTECFVMYMKNISINESKPLTNTSVKVTVESDPTCTKANVKDVKSINVTIDVTASTKHKIVLTYTADARYWTLAEASFDDILLSVQRNDYLLNAHIFRNQSYHCNAETVFSHPRINNPPVDGVTVRIDRMQVQAFDNLDKKFSDKIVDCVGFFTAPLWMSLIISLVLISISCCGVGLLHNVSTFDRYDDPKGKPLTVTISE